MANATTRAPKGKGHERTRGAAGKGSSTGSQRASEAPAAGPDQSPSPPTLSHRDNRKGMSTETAPSSDGAQSSATTVDTQVPPAITNKAQQTRLKVIKFSSVSKRFVLHHERARSFQDIVVSLFGLRTPSKRGVALPEPANQVFWALHDVNFGVYQGEAVGIIGENGSGKSTTLKLISRILTPTSGSVSVRGKVSALLELGTGFHPDLTGRENIFLNGSLLGIPRKEMVERFKAIVDFAELSEFIDTPIKHYSSGMVMRLGFAVAINVDPDILLTDEVLAVGDEAFQRKCLEYIAFLRKRGVTIVFVSHALDAVRSLCKRAIWLDHGRLVADGPSGEVIDKYLTYENEKHAERLHNIQEGRPAASTIVPLPTPMETAAVDSPEEEVEELAGETEQAAEQEIASQPESVNDVPGSRLTTGEVQITEVRFVNGEGVETTLFETAKPLTIRLFYEALKRIEEPIFGLALYTQNGVHLNGPNTRFSGLEIPFVEGSGYVDYRIDELPLLSGIYDVTVAVTGKEMADVLDHRHRAYSFTVQPTPGLPERWGLLYMPATWSFHPGDGENRKTSSE